MTYRNNNYPQYAVNQLFLPLLRRNLVLRAVLQSTVRVHMAAAFLHLSNLLTKLGIDFGTVNHQHQFRIQINTSHIEIAGAYNTHSIICQNSFCMLGLFSQILINMNACITNFLFLVQIIGSSKGIGSIFHSINQDFCGDS